MSFDRGRSAFDDLCLVSVEALKQLVCRAFGVSNELVAEYQRLVFQPHRKKQDAKIIAEDLLYLLSLLETNRHPYYAPDKFLVCVIESDSNMCKVAFVTIVLKCHCHCFLTVLLITYLFCYLSSYVCSRILTSEFCANCFYKRNLKL